MFFFKFSLNLRFNKWSLSPTRVQKRTIRDCPHINCKFCFFFIFILFPVLRKSVLLLVVSPAASLSPPLSPHLSTSLSLYLSLLLSLSPSLSLPLSTPSLSHSFPTSLCLSLSRGILLIQTG